MGILGFPTGDGAPGATGPAGPPGPAGSAPTGTLAALTASNTFLARLSTGLTAHDGTAASSKALLGGGMCAPGGALGATVAYQTSGPVTVGTTGWTQDVPLYPNAVGGMVPLGDATLTGTYSRACGTYDGTSFSVAIGPPEDFT